MEKTIIDLLYRYQSVYIPSWGSFYTKRTSAKSLSGKNLLYPPHQKIGFRETFVSGSVNIAEHIASEEKIPVDLAKKLVDDQVFSWEKTLEENGVLYLNGLGEIKKAGKRKIFFPDFKNINPLENFGLGIISVKPLPRIQPVETQKTYENKHITHEPASALTLEQILNNRPTYSPSPVASSRWMRYAAVTVLGLAMLWGIYKSIPYWKINNRPEPIHVQQATYTLPDVLPAIEIHTQSVITNEATNHIEKPVFIIAGAFRLKRNADKMMRRIKQMGFSPVYAGKNARGLHLIAYGKFKTRSEAEQTLEEIKQRYNPQAWILAR